MPDGESKTTRIRRATNASTIKRIALEYAKATRYHKFTEVSNSVTDEAEAVMIAWIKNKVNRQPSKGKTIR
jgi:hypothetical protein